LLKGEPEEEGAGAPTGADMDSSFHDWESLNSETDRLAVPGGWLYRTAICDEDGNSVALCFVPDAGAPHVKSP
ncbi:hypothetical protein LCGC14_2475060, partial [marine sediment metagenome]